VAGEFGVNHPAFPYSTADAFSVTQQSHSGYVPQRCEPHRISTDYLWSGSALPAGMSQTAYVHRGAYPLSVT